MIRLLIVGILIISTGPLFAQAQPNPAKLKADAQKITSTIRSDKAKTQIYCQLNSLSDQIEEAARAKDARKVETLNQRADDLEKQLGPEYRALFDALNSADPNSNDVLDIMSMFDKLDDSCPH